MNILALDLGTHAGYAMRVDGKIRHGMESFEPRSKEGAGQRWLRFRAFLTQALQAAGEIHAVYFEDVRHMMAGQVISAHVYGGFKATLEAWCEANRVQLIPVGVGTIKRSWTGKGNAKKPEMVKMARQRGFRLTDDNEADALALLDYALKHQKQTRLQLPDAPIFAPKDPAADWVDPFKDRVAA